MAARLPRTGQEGTADRRLHAIGRTGLAWEWLRRDRNYAAIRPASSAGEDRPALVAASPDQEARWGCVNIEMPDRSVGEVRLLWSSSIDPSVLEVEVVPSGAADQALFDLSRFCDITAMVPGHGREHILLGEGPSAIRLDVLKGTLSGGPAALRFVFDGNDSCDEKVAALRRFLYLHRTGVFMPVRQTMTRRYRRALVALSVHDALLEGASIRDIGELLYGPARVRAEWNAPGESLKSSSRRLIILARTLAAGGYKTLLR